MKATAFRTSMFGETRPPVAYRSGRRIPRRVAVPRLIGAMSLTARKGSLQVGFPLGVGQAIDCCGAPAQRAGPD